MGLLQRNGRVLRSSPASRTTTQTYTAFHRLIPRPLYAGCGGQALLVLLELFDMASYNT